jgi:lysozyme
MRTGFDGLYLLRHYEDCKLIAYPDPASDLFAALRRSRIDPYSLRSVQPPFDHFDGKPWTIGWGSTGPDVVPGLVITQTDADIRLTSRLEREFEPAVESLITSGATQKQFDAFVSFAYNVGTTALRRSSLLRLHNARDYAGAAREFAKWCKAGTRPLKGLQRRRAAERYVYNGMGAQWAVHAAEDMYP